MPAQHLFKQADMRFQIPAVPARFARAAGMTVYV